MENEEKINLRKERFKSWLKDKNNLYFLAILIFAIIIRLYYFSLTKTQPLWWDESDYMAYAKNLAGLSSDWIITSQHNSIYPFFSAFLFKLAFSDVIVKFFLQLLPSVLSVFLVYHITTSMYKDKKIALIASFLMATFWVVLFNTMRFHVGIPALFFGLLAIYTFWQGYERKEKLFGKISHKWAIPLTVVFTILTYTTRRGYILFGVFFALYMLSTRSIKDLVKDKYNWIALALVIALFLLAENAIFISEFSDVASTYTHPDKPINFLPFDVFPAYFVNGGSILGSSLLYLFWIGVVIALLNLVMHLGYIKKSNNKELRADLFALISIIVTLAFFIFFLRTQHVYGEPRWYLPLAFSSFIMIARGTTSISNYLKKYSKYLAIAFVFILIGFGGYYQVKQADEVIKNRVNTYTGIRDASLFVKEISNQNDVIISQPVPQAIYYSERKVIQPEVIVGKTSADYTLEEFLQGLHENTEVRFLFVSFSEGGHPDWMQRVSQGAWEIPFMDTRIDFSTNQQNIVREKTFDGITFNLLEIKQDVFIYEIVR